MVCHCLLVETNHGLVLIDTGFGQQDVANPTHLGRPFLALVGAKPQLAETAIEQVRALGFKPEDVQHIIPTHLDLDHAGGLPDFPHAQVHVHRHEHQAAMHPHWDERARYRPLHFKHQPKWVLHSEQGERWFGFAGITPISQLKDDIVLIPMPGHTRGHCAVGVRTATGWLVHAGDAYFHHNAMNTEDAPIPLGIRIFEQLVQVNGPLRIENQLRLRDLVNQPASGVESFCAHDPVEYQRYATGTAA